jgi:hypothetical protein
MARSNPGVLVLSSHRRSTHVTLAPHLHNRARLAPSNVAKRLALERKTVSFGQRRFGLERRPETKRGWRIGSIVGQPTATIFYATPGAVAEELRCGDDIAVHTCG